MSFCFFLMLGLHLPEETRTEIKALKNRINDLCIQFSKYVNDESTVLEFTEEELFGTPADFLSGLKKVSFWLLYLILYRKGRKSIINTKSYTFLFRLLERV